MARRAAKPALATGAAAAGIASAVTARKALKPKQRTILGLPVSSSKLRVRIPNNGFGLDGVKKNLPTDVDAVASGITRAGQNVGRAGKRLCSLGNDIERAGETTERFGKLIAK